MLYKETSGFNDRSDKLDLELQLGANAKVNQDDIFTARGSDDGSKN